MRCVALLLLVYATGHGQSQSLDPTDLPRSDTRVVDSSPNEYTIRMGGTMDGANTRDPIVFVSRPWTQGFRPMRFVRLENYGETDILNPRLTVNNRGNWHTLEDIVAEALASYGDPAIMSAGEKARALWDFVRLNRFHASTGDEEVRDPVKLFNVYGYALCGDNAPALMDLWRAAGLKVRRGFPTGHCIGEVWYDGAWHMLDADEPLIVTGRDNRTIVSESEIVRDHDLVRRLRGHARSAALYTYDGSRSGEYASYAAHRMALRLRPGESIEWGWRNSDKHHYSAELDPEIHLDSTLHLRDSWGAKAWDLVANGKWRYEPPLRAPYARAGVVASNIRWPETSSEPAAVPATAGRPATLTWEVRSPYVIVGGKVRAGFRCAGGDRCTLLFSEDGRGWTPVAQAGPRGESELNVSLDPYFPNKGAARYGYFLRAELLAESTAGGAGLNALAVENDLQMAPLSLPALEIGENRIRYRDESLSGRRARLIFDWVERSSSKPPDPPARPLFPVNDAQVEGTAFTFRWSEAHDLEGEGIADYHFQLSDEQALRWALSPNFDVLISDVDRAVTAAYSIAPDGLLNPGERYYWRVRAKSRRGVWSRWSDTWSFTPSGPGVPLKVRFAEVDAGRFALQWDVNPNGRPPKRFEIYASNERGFTVSDTAYEVEAGNQERQGLFPGKARVTFPKNHLAGAAETTYSVRPEHAFYRVVAVDERGNRSGTSDFAAAPRPFIFTDPVTEAKAGLPYRYEPKTVLSIGDLRYRALAANPDSYQLAYWDAEKPSFSLVEEVPRCGHPDAIWLKIDPETGVLSGRPHKPAVYHINVQAEIPGVGKHVQSFALRVTP